MIKLLRSNFSRVLRNRLFWICMVFSVGFGAVIDIMRYSDLVKYSELYPGQDLGLSVDRILFIASMCLIFAAAVFVGPFLGTDYACGTLRNKLIAGHKRSNIYFANFITAATVNVGMLLAFIFTTLALGVPLLGLEELTSKQIVFFTFSQCLAMIAFTALLVFLSMLFQSKAGGSVAVLVLTILLFVSAMLIPEALRKPEYREIYVTSVIDEETDVTALETEKVKNPYYIDGIMRNIYEFLNDALPVNQFNQIAEHDESHLGIMAAYSVALIVLSNGVGMILFRRRNIT